MRREKTNLNYYRSHPNSHIVLNVFKVENRSKNNKNINFLPLNSFLYSFWRLSFLTSMGEKVFRKFHKSHPYIEVWYKNIQLCTCICKPPSPLLSFRGRVITCSRQITRQWFDNILRTKKPILQYPLIKPILKARGLNGLELFLESQLIDRNTILCRKLYFVNLSSSLNFIGYKSNFVLITQSKRLLRVVRTVLNEFLVIRGLKITEQHIKTFDLLDGFDFLGWTYNLYKRKILLVTISQKNICLHKQWIKGLTQRIYNIDVLLAQLNFRIRDWVNYNRCCHQARNVWGQISGYLYICLIKWCTRRHGRKSKKWIYNRYWRKIDNRTVFFYREISFDNSLFLGSYYTKRQKIKLRLKSSITIVSLRFSGMIKNFF